jgi:glycosyltransferase involved in cell wall biosynthesis
MNIMNNETIKISVILPIYKVEKYLKKCVDSVLDSTYKNLEVILVDDGSPDACPQICDDYAKSDSRVIVIHKENGGLCSARNAGLAVASGDYISFIDSDDSISQDGYQFAVNQIVSRGGN